MESSIKSLIILVVLAATSAPLAAEQSASDRPEARHFTLKVLPLLKEKCFGCHGADANNIKGGYDVRTREAILQGGESEEAAIIPGNPDESPFYQAVIWEGLEMPPKENDRLTDEQTKWVRRWIKAGAPWSDEKTQQQIMKAEQQVDENEFGVLVATSGGLGDQWTYRRYQKEEIWAFRPVRELFDFDSIDAFIDDKLKTADLSPAAMASPEQLLRRATFDLTGLPPTPRRDQRIPGRLGAGFPASVERFSRSFAREPALRRTLGATLVGRCALRRHRRLFQRLRTQQCVAISRLRHSFAEQ